MSSSPGTETSLLDSVRFQGEEDAAAEPLNPTESSNAPSRIHAGAGLKQYLAYQARRQREARAKPRLIRPTRPYLMLATLIAVDAAMLVLPAAVVTLTYAGLNGLEMRGYYELWPFLPMVMLAFLLGRLYPAVPLCPADEVRRIVVVVTVSYLGLAAAMYIIKSITRDMRTVLLLSWLGTMVTANAGRMFLRFVCAPRSWWGYSTLILGAGPAGRSLLKSLKRQPEIGLKPIAVLDNRIRPGRMLADVPVAGPLDQAAELGEKHGIHYAIIAAADMTPVELDRTLKTAQDRFSHLMVVPDVPGMGSLWVDAKDLGGHLGLEMRHRLLQPGQRRFKRAMDLVMVMVLSPMLLPILVAIAMAVRLDSRGSVFFTQERIGRDGKTFRIVKFRTMVQDAGVVLESYLQAHPELRSEWNRTRKLRDDPRVTRVGRVLRKTSLDELPQLWNVMAGQMSLVGPRPIVDEEVRLYGDQFDLFKKVRPGVTGLWQTSGRNAIRYAERVRMDAYYVRNWSIWLDLYLLARTVLAVLRRRGAY